MYAVKNGTVCGHCDRNLKWAMVAYDGKHFCTNFCLAAYKIAQKYAKAMKK